jgi:hypothetical protein
MPMFIGMKIDEISTSIIRQWLLKCQGTGLQDPLKPQFIYIPIAYSHRTEEQEDENLRRELLGQIQGPLKLDNCCVRRLGETGNVSLVFRSLYLQERNKFWVSKCRKFRKHQPYIPRIPMSHSSNYLSFNWTKSLNIREVTLVEEFSTTFDRTQFLREVEKSNGD